MDEVLREILGEVDKLRASAGEEKGIFQER
jgi:hypothetical protein